MNKKILLSLLILPALLCAQTSLISDSFGDGGRTNGTDPLDAAWWYRGTGTQLTVASGAGLTNALSFNSNNNVNSFVAALPQAITLAATGDWLQVSYSYSRSANGNFNSGLRVGFFDIATVPTADAFGTGFDAALGYTAELPSVGQGNGALRLREDTDAASNRLMDTQGNTTGQLFSIQNGVHDVPAFDSVDLPMTITFRLERVLTGTQLTVGSSLSGTTYSVIDTVTPYSEFNSIGFSQVSANQVNYWDNIVVTTSVPEPSTLLLMGLAGLTAILTLRRRR